MMGAAAAPAADKRMVSLRRLPRSPATAAVNVYLARRMGQFARMRRAADRQ
jgi:hypothetical protein